MKTITFILFMLIPFFSLHAQRYCDVRAVTLKVMSQTDPAEAMIMAQECEKDCNQALSLQIFNIYTNSGGDLQWPYVYKVFTTAKEPFYLSEKLGDMVGHLRNPMYAQQGIEALKKLGVTRKEYQDKISAILLLIKSNRLLLHDDISAEAAEKAITAL